MSSVAKMFDHMIIDNKYRITDEDGFPWWYIHGNIDFVRETFRDDIRLIDQDVAWSENQLEYLKSLRSKPEILKTIVHFQRISDRFCKGSRWPASIADSVRSLRQCYENDKIYEIENDELNDWRKSLEEEFEYFIEQISRGIESLKERQQKERDILQKLSVVKNNKWELRLIKVDSQDEIKSVIETLEANDDIEVINKESN